MDLHKERFAVHLVEEAFRVGALSTGSYTLKSGRKSPYFFNSAKLNNGSSFDTLTRAYASVIHHGLSEGRLEPFDVLFGPAYKGIPLVSCIATTLCREHGRSYHFAYNRKESKGHGEGSDIVGDIDKLLTPGATMRVVIVDDVITAGTAITEAISMLRAYAASKSNGSSIKVQGVIVALDRQEVYDQQDPDGRSAAQVVEDLHTVKVFSAFTAFDILDACKNTDSFTKFSHDIHQYLTDYGCRELKDKMHGQPLG